MFKIIISCSGLSEIEGLVFAEDVTEEFALRPWHRKATCMWDGGRLILRVENDFDSDGLATLDEFSDALCACLPKGIEFKLEIAGVLKADE